MKEFVVVDILRVQMNRPLPAKKETGVPEENPSTNKQSPKLGIMTFQKGKSIVPDTRVRTCVRA